MMTDPMQTPMERAKSLHTISVIESCAITYIADEIHYAVLAERERCASLSCPPTRVPSSVVVGEFRPTVTDEHIAGYNQAWSDFAAAIREETTDE